MLAITESAHSQPNQSRLIGDPELVQPHETQMAFQMMGLDYFFDEYLLQAAKFLSGKR